MNKRMAFSPPSVTKQMARPTLAPTAHTGERAHSLALPSFPHRKHTKPHMDPPPALCPGLEALERGDVRAAAECAAAVLEQGECYEARW
mgnify:CR=1 FL=1